MPGRRRTGFKSKAQWKLFFANPRLRRYARQKARATKGGKITRYRRLPARRSARR
ncbi:hypothetical protein [Streptomyces sp. SID8374]|uniref:hypothetical protein n=1 Tax=Streptomyces sp. SID8374 TaxID=2690354 RepID=UPI00192729BA|nr:hypothetical protein [Streptomyces sp. SID8374]